MIVNARGRDRGSSRSTMVRRFLISFLVTAVIILLLFTQISLRDLSGLLMKIDPLWAGIGSLFYLLAVLFRALRYQWLIHSRKVLFSKLFQISAIYNLAITVLPSKFGELTYPYFLNRAGGVNFTEGLASLIASRIYDLCVILVIFSITATGSQDTLRIGLFWIILISGGLACLIVIVLLNLSRLLAWFSMFMEKWSSQPRTKVKKPLQWLQKKIQRISEDFHAINAKRGYLPVALATTLSWIMIFLMFHAFLKGFGITVPFLKVVFGSSVAILASTIPISGLGNWGMLEAGWAAGFLLVGLSKESAIATGFGVHILIFMVSALTGLLCWLLLRRQSPSLPA
jgi:glycosyltransferase 2 family protein